MAVAAICTMLAMAMAACGDDGSTNGEDHQTRPPAGGGDVADTPGDSDPDASPGTQDTADHSSHSASPNPSETEALPLDSITVRLTNGNAVQPVTVLTGDANGHQGWWRIIEPGPPPFVELRTLPFLGVCPCSEPDCDASLPPGDSQETMTLQPNESVEDSWDGSIWVRDTSAFPPCQYSRHAGPGPWRVQFTYSPGVEGEDGQIPQPSIQRSDEFRLGEDTEAGFTTP